MLTKKDFKKVAEIFKARLEADRNDDNDDLITAFCEWFKEDNPNFNEDKFREAIFGKE